MKLNLALITIVLACFGLPALAQQPASGLDATWGTSGTQILGITGYEARMADMAVAADGSSYSIGTAINQGTTPRTRLVVVKLTPSGTLDTTFNSNGSLFITNGTAELSNPRIALQSDGKVIICCNSRQKLFVQRLNTSGQIDTTFGSPTGLYFATAFAGNGTSEVRCVSLLVRSNGTILLLAWDSNAVSSVVSELSSAGVRNTQNTFIASLAAFSRSPPLSMALQSDGKLMVSCLQRNSVAQARFNTDDSLDETFAVKGIRVTANLDRTVVERVAASPDGGIWATGYATVGYVSNIVRFKTDGSIGETFGTKGVVLVPRVPEGGLIVRPSDGRLFMGGAPSGGLAVRRYRSDGALDANFGDHGIVSAPDDPNSYLAITTGVTQGADGKLYLYGSAVFREGVGHFVWARVNPGPVEPVVAPVVTQNPASITINRTEDTAYPVTFTVGLAAGNPITPWCRWKHGDTIIAITQGPALTLPDATYLDAGDYSVEVGNDAGSTVVTGFSLTVGSPPVIKQKPVSYSGPREENYVLRATFAGRPPFTIEWTCSNPKATLPSPQLVTTDNNKTYVSSLTQLVNASNSGNYRVKITNAEGSVTSDAATLEALPGPPLFVERYDAPFIYAAAPGQLIEIGYSLRGVTPMTYRWQKNGVNYTSLKKIVGAANSGPDPVASLSLPAATSSSGSYRCVATNADGTTAGSPITVVVLPDPFAWQSFKRYVVGEYGTLDLSAEIYGQTPITGYQWQHNGRNVEGSGNVFSIASATPEDAGRYRLVLTSAKGRSVGDEAIVTVVRNPGFYPNAVALGKTAFINLSIAGPTDNLAFHWRRDDDKPIAPGRATGIDRPTLTISNCSLDDAGSYVCEITAPNQVVSSFGNELQVETEKPELVGGPLEAGTVAYMYGHQFNASNSGTFSVEGLPAGLSIHPTGGFITGVPRESGDFQVRITAQNPVGSVTAAYPLKIAPLNANTPGDYTVLLTNNAPHTQGALHFVIAPSGAYTGKVSLTFDSGTLHTRSFTGELVFDPGGNPNPDPPGTISIPALGITQGIVHPNATANGESLHPTFEYTNPNGEVVNLASSITKAYWNATTRPATQYAGYYTAELQRPDLGPTTPGSIGSGYAAFTIGANGKFVFTGRMPDGSVFATPSVLGKNGDARPLAWMHDYHGDLITSFTIKAGTSADFHDNGVTGEVTWHRRTSLIENLFTPGTFLTIATEAGYYLQGAKYLPPNSPHLTSPLCMNAKGPLPNGNISLLGNGMPSGFTAELNITTGRQIKIATRSIPIDAPCKVSSLSFSADRGEFFGTYTTKDNRRGILRGIVTRNDTSVTTSYGVGFFYDTHPPSKRLTSGWVGMAPKSAQPQTIKRLSSPSGAQR